MPRSSFLWSPPTSSGSPGERCLTRWSPGSVTPRRWRSWHVPACAPSSASWRRPSPATSATITGSCWPGCLAASTRPAPTSPSWRPRSRRRSPRSRRRPTGWMRSPGSAAPAAQVIIAEIGTDMGRFPTPGHLASWARFAPGVKQSAGKPKGKATTGHGNPYLARVLGEAAVAAGRTNTFLGERYRRLAKRRGTKKAIVAVGRSILIIVWHLLADPTARFHDLGAGFYDTRINPERAKRNHIRQLEALGYKVTLEPAA